MQGRTARYDKDGKALLLLLPSEARMAEKLAARNVPCRKTELNAAKQRPITPHLQSFCAQDPDLKYLAQKVRACACVRADVRAC